MSFPTIGFTSSYGLPNYGLPSAPTFGAGFSKATPPVNTGIPAFDTTNTGIQATAPAAGTQSTLPMYGDQYNARTNNALNSTDSKYANVTLAQNTHNALSNCFSVSPPAESVCKHNKADDSGYWSALGMDESA